MVDAINTELVWAGRAWPAAEIIGRTGEDFAFKTSGKGRPLELDGPAAWWRNFSELNLDDPDAVTGFVRRRGDPFGALSPTTQANSSQWGGVAAVLKLAASCWTRNRVGTSVFVGQGPGVMRAMVASPSFQHGIEYEPWVVRGEFSLRIVAKTLAAFMTASATFHVQSRVDMAVCQHCGDWFVERRRGTQFCSASCRAASSTLKKERK